MSPRRWFPLLLGLAACQAPAPTAPSPGTPVPVRGPVRLVLTEVPINTGAIQLQLNGLTLEAPTLVSDVQGVVLPLGPASWAVVITGALPEDGVVLEASVAGEADVEQATPLVVALATTAYELRPPETLRVRWRDDRPRVTPTN